MEATQVKGKEGSESQGEGQDEGWRGKKGMGWWRVKSEGREMDRSAHP